MVCFLSWKLGPVTVPTLFKQQSDWLKVKFSKQKQKQKTTTKMNLSFNFASEIFSEYSLPPDTLLILSMNINCFNIYYPIIITFF